MKKSMFKLLSIVPFLFAIGYLLPQPQAKATPAPPVTCDQICSHTQYMKACGSGLYMYFTQPTCLLCGATAGAQSWNCVRKTTGPSCRKIGAMKGKAIMSSLVCPCTVGATNYDYAEAAVVDAGTVTGDDIDRYQCAD